MAQQIILTLSEFNAINDRIIAEIKTQDKYNGVKRKEIPIEEMLQRFRAITGSYDYKIIPDPAKYQPHQV